MPFDPLREMGGRFGNAPFSRKKATSSSKSPSPFAVFELRSWNDARLDDCFEIVLEGVVERWKRRTGLNPPKLRPSSESESEMPPVWTLVVTKNIVMTRLLL